MSDHILVEKPELKRFWEFFRLPTANSMAISMTGHVDGSHMFYRCAACGATIDCRDHGIHLQYHGINSTKEIAELIDSQEKYSGLRGRK